MPNPFINLHLAQNAKKPTVFVDRDKLSEISKYATDGIQHDLPWELLLVGLGTTLTAIAIISARRWWRKRHQDPSPIVLYSAIARKAGLGWRDRLLLWRIAKAFQLPTPIALLIAQGTLQHYSKRYLGNHSSRPRLSQRLAQIESTLFG